MPPNSTARTSAVPDASDGPPTPPTLKFDPGLALLRVPSPRTPVIHRLVCSRLREAGGPAYWIDTRNVASTHALYDCAPSPRTLRGLEIARAFTAYQHHSLVRRTVETAGSGTTLVVAPNVTDLYRDSDLANWEREDLLSAALSTLRELGRTLECPRGRHDRPRGRRRDGRGVRRRRVRSHARGVPPRARGRGRDRGLLARRLLADDDSLLGRVLWHRRRDRLRGRGPRSGAARPRGDGRYRRLQRRRRGARRADGGDGLIGRTNPTYRDAIRRLESRWRPMCRALRRQYQVDFDRLFERAREFADAAGYANPPDPERALLFSLLLAHEVELRGLEERLEAADGEPTSTSEDAPAAENGDEP